MDIGQTVPGTGTRPRGRAGEGVRARTPIDGRELARLRADSREDVGRIVSESHAAFLRWRDWPAPKRGELVRLFGAELRGAKEALARLVTIESGKILEEGLRRSAGDDRHLRLRRGPVAPAATA